MREFAMTNAGKAYLAQIASIARSLESIAESLKEIEKKKRDEKPSYLGPK